MVELNSEVIDYVIDAHDKRFENIEHSLHAIEHALNELKININGANYSVASIQKNLESTMVHFEKTSQRLLKLEESEISHQERLSKVEHEEKIRKTKSDLFSKIFSNWIVWVFIIAVIGALDFGHFINLIKHIK